MNTTTMNTNRTAASRTRLAAAAAVLAGATLLLAGCGGPSADGTYVTDGGGEVNGTTILNEVIVKGDEVTLTERDCGGDLDKDHDGDVTNIGELNDDKTQVTWSSIGDDSRNDHGESATESFSTTENTVAIGDDSFSNVEEDAGKQIVDTFEKEHCN